MIPNQISVRQAIDRGLKTISRPSKIIFFAPIILCVLLMVLTFSWLYLALVPIGILASFIYTIVVTPRWRPSAYEQVPDIHQLQRSAEIARLLPWQSYNKPTGFMSADQRIKLAALQQRFLLEPSFVDDASVPVETRIMSSGIFASSCKPVLILNASGIQVIPQGNFSWGEIENDRVAKVSYTYPNRLGSYSGRPGSSGDFFRFQCGTQQVEVPFSTIDCSTWMLDLLLYIYRGRSEHV